MVYSLILMEQLLMVLMMIISCRSFFALKKQSLFTDPLFLSTALGTSLIRWVVPSFAGLVLSSAACYLASSLLFKGSPKKKALFGLILVSVYCLLFLAAGWIMAFNRIGFNADNSFWEFLQALFAQLLGYMILFLANNVIHKKKYGISYYLGLVPIFISMLPVFLWSRYPGIAFIEPAVPFIFLLILVFDFGCMALQSWIIMNLNTRANIRLDQIEREHLISKYEILEDQYEESFSFLHQLLSLCAALSRDIDVKDRQTMLEQTEDIAELAFVKFNAVAISTPVLNRQLEKRKEELQKAGILVSAMIRSDYFALMTFDEQELLFDSILSFIQPKCAKAPGASRIIVIKAAKVLSDIMLTWTFSASSDPQNDPAFEKLQKKLSRKLRAGTKISWNPNRNQAILTVLLPPVMPDLPSVGSVRF